MQKKNKYVKNLTIGALTGGLIAGGICFSLTGRKPFIRDYLNTYSVTRDTTIKTTDGLTRLFQTSDFLTSNEKVDIYGFTNGSLKDEEITIKQNEFENGNSLSVITNFDNTDKYQVEKRELPESYENILEEINIRNVDYDNVIKIRESRTTNMMDTTIWILITAYGVIGGAAIAKIIGFERKNLKKSK